MDTVITNAQAKCQEADKIADNLSRAKRILLRLAIKNVHVAIGDNNIPKLLERTKNLSRVYNEVKR